MAQPRKDAAARPISERVERSLSVDHRCGPSERMTIAQVLHQSDSLD